MSIKKSGEKQEDPPVRPELYISMIIIFLIIILMYTGQWDWVLVVFIGLLVGNGLSGLRRR